MPSDAHEGRRGDKDNVAVSDVSCVASKQNAAGSTLADRGVCEQRIAVSATANYLLSRVFFRHVAICRVYVPVFANTGFHDEAEIYQTEL